MKTLQRVFLLVFVLSMGTLCCKQRPRDESSTKFFNTRNTGLFVSLSGEILLSPPSDEMVEKIILWNAKEASLTHKNDKKAQEDLEKLTNPQTQKEQLNAAKEKLKLNDVKYWITKQLEHPIFYGQETITLSIDYNSLNVKRSDKSEGAYEYSIEAYISSSRDYTEILQNLTVYLPKNPVTIFFDTNPFSALEDIEKTRNENSAIKCFTPDGDPVAPHNYFFYLDPYNYPDCIAKYKDFFYSTKFTKVIPLSMKNSYPEYQELFSDKKLEILIALNEVSNDQGPLATSRREFQMITRTLEYNKKFKLTKQNSDFDVEYSRDIPSKAGGNITVTVRVIYDTSIYAIKEKLFAGGINNEIIIYAGHSAYGKYLETLFGEETPYPRNKYQIIFPYSCLSFGYISSRILATKARLDSDDRYYFIDVISTARTATGGTADASVPVEYEFSVLMSFIDFFSQAAELFGAPEIANLTYQNLLKTLDEKDHKVEIKKAVFTVVGETDNFFNPEVQTDARPNVMSGTRLEDGGIAIEHQGDALKVFLKDSLVAKSIFEMLRDDQPSGVKISSQNSMTKKTFIASGKLGSQTLIFSCYETPTQAQKVYGCELQATGVNPTSTPLKLQKDKENKYLVLRNDNESRYSFVAKEVFDLFKELDAKPVSAGRDPHVNVRVKAGQEFNIASKTSNAEQFQIQCRGNPKDMGSYFCKFLVKIPDHKTLDFNECSKTPRKQQAKVQSSCSIDTLEDETVDEEIKPDNESDSDLN